MPGNTTRSARPPRVLYAASEAWPLIKTGGLGDVAHALPNALHALGAELRLVLPAYREVLRQVEDLRILGWLDLDDGSEARIVQARHPAFAMPLWLVDIGELFDREGNPYVDPEGRDWPDNPQRFTRFSRAVALLGVDALATGWRPDIVHANDWQTGSVAALLRDMPQSPRCLYTIHNLAYDGQFDHATFEALHLPAGWWSIDGAEFHGRFSPMKAGLVYSDRINTVSPTYAREIQTPEHGYGYAGILQHLRHKLSGILNGIDTRVWDPAHDPLIATNYDCDSDLEGARHRNRKALLEALGAAPRAAADHAPVIGFVGRLVHQKGIDLLLEVIPELVRNTTARFAIVGSGERQYQTRLETLHRRFPERVFCHIGYSEPLAHQLEAGADIFAMPSRYEPCGLNQLYSLRYGTPPVVRRTGGLADTVTHAEPHALAEGRATGFVFDEPTAPALAQALRQALHSRQDPVLWRQLQCAGMQRPLGWEQSARRYLELYRTILQD